MSHPRTSPQRTAYENKMLSRDTLNPCKVYTETIIQYISQTTAMGIKIRESRFGNQDQGIKIRESSSGNQDQGIKIRESSSGNQDQGLGIKIRESSSGNQDQGLGIKFWESRPGNDASLYNCEYTHVPAIHVQLYNS